MHINKIICNMIIMGDSTMKENHEHEYEEKLVKRLIELRQQKNVSARDMSLSLGQSDGYINKIENRKSMPSLFGFFCICEYFGITPKEFFDYETESPAISNALSDEIRRLDYAESMHILEVVRDINKRRK